MANLSSKDRLQPSLFDRLADELAPALAQLAEARSALDRLLDAPQRAALGELLEAGPAGNQRLTLPQAGALADLGGEARSLLDRVLELEQVRRSEQRRAIMLSSSQLRAAVLRDLQTLLNTTAAEAQPDGTEGVLSRWPCAEASVVNYGIPALAGRIRTHEDFVDFSQRLERAIERHEPRLRRVRVQLGESATANLGTLTSPIDLVIEGELWGFPVFEHLLVRTVLDLDAGRVQVAGQGQAA